MQYKPLVWIIVALVAIIILLVLFQPQQEDRDDTAFYDRIEELEVRDKASKEMIHNLLAKIDSDSTRNHQTIQDKQSRGQNIEVPCGPFKS